MLSMLTHLGNDEYRRAFERGSNAVFRHGSLLNRVKLPKETFFVFLCLVAILIELLHFSLRSGVILCYRF